MIITGKLTRIRRLQNTPSGNPRYELQLDRQYHWRTKSDAQTAFVIDAQDHLNKVVCLELKEGFVVGYHVDKGHSHA